MKGHNNPSSSPPPTGPDTSLDPGRCLRRGRFRTVRSWSDRPPTAKGNARKIPRGPTRAGKPLARREIQRSGRPWPGPGEPPGFSNRRRPFLQPRQRGRACSPPRNGKSARITPGPELERGGIIAAVNPPAPEKKDPGVMSGEGSGPDQRAYHGDGAMRIVRATYPSSTPDPVPTRICGDLPRDQGVGLHDSRFPAGRDKFPSTTRRRAQRTHHVR